jgi:hypothetical protein
VHKKRREKNKSLNSYPKLDEVFISSNIFFWQQLYVKKTEQGSAQYLSPKN